MLAAWGEGPETRPPTTGTGLDTVRVRWTCTAAAAAAAAEPGVAPAKAATLTEAWLSSLYTRSSSISRLDSDSDKCRQRASRLSISSCSLLCKRRFSSLISLSSLTYSAIFASCSPLAIDNWFLSRAHSAFKARMLLAKLAAVSELLLILEL